MFTVLDGEVRVTFRGQTITARAGETINVPANAPHSFTNAADTPLTGEPAHHDSPPREQKFPTLATATAIADT
jgi:quercetin dioxygenase-like cupin family protein